MNCLMFVYDYAELVQGDHIKQVNQQWLLVSQLMNICHGFLWHHNHHRITNLSVALPLSCFNFCCWIGWIPIFSDAMLKKMCWLMLISNIIKSVVLNFFWLILKKNVLLVTYIQFAESVKFGTVQLVLVAYIRYYTIETRKIRWILD